MEQGLFRQRAESQGSGQVPPVAVTWFVPLIPTELSPAALGRLLPDRSASAQLLGANPEHERLQVALPWQGPEAGLPSGLDANLHYQGGDIAILQLSWEELTPGVHPLDVLIGQLDQLRGCFGYTFPWASDEPEWALPGFSGVALVDARLQLEAFGLSWAPLHVPSGPGSMVEATVLVLAENDAFGVRRDADVQQLSGGGPTPRMERLRDSVTVDIASHSGPQSLISVDARHLVLNVQESLGFHGSQGLDSARIEATESLLDLMGARTLRTWEAWRAAHALDTLRAEPASTERSSAVHDLRELRSRRGIRRFGSGLAVPLWYEGSTSDGDALRRTLQDRMDRDLMRVDAALDQLSESLEDAEQSESMALMASLAQSAEQAQAKLRPVAIAFGLLALASLWVGISAIPAGEGAFWPAVPRALSLLIALGVLVGVLAFVVDRLANRHSAKQGRTGLYSAAGLFAALAAGLGVLNVLSDSSSGWILAGALVCAGVACGLIAYGWSERPPTRDDGYWRRPQLAADPARGVFATDTLATQTLKDLSRWVQRGGTNEDEAGDLPGRVRDIGRHRLRSVAAPAEWEMVQPVLQQWRVLE